MVQKKIGAAVLTSTNLLTDAKLGSINRSTAGPLNIIKTRPSIAQRLGIGRSLASALKKNIGLQVANTNAYCIFYTRIGIST